MPRITSVSVHSCSQASYAVDCTPVITSERYPPREVHVMPYAIRKGGGSCRADQWAVVNKSTGKSMGCHSTKKSAQKQLAALNINVVSKEAQVSKLLTEARPSLSATPVEGKPGRFLIQLISPGWGSSGYYSPEVLEAAGKAKVWPKGTHMYLDHPTRTEEYDRPERSVRDLAGALAEDAHWDSGLQSLVAEADVFGAYRSTLDQMADDIGVSIRAYAESEQGSAEGRNGTIVTELVEGISADFVTHAGRGGKILQVIESARERLAEAVSDAAWSQFSDSDYSDAQYAAACVLDRGPDAGSAKQRYGLRVKQPDGTVNRNGVHAAAQRLGSVKGATPEQKRAAAKKLVSLYRNQLDEDPPASLLKAAGMKSESREALLAQLRESRNVGQWIESRLHLALTRIGDDMYGNGRLTREERIALSGAVGDALDAFTTNLEKSAPALYQRDLWDDPEAIADQVDEATRDVPDLPAGRTPTQESEEDTMPQIEEARLRQLEEDAGRVPTLTSERDAAVQRAESAEAERDEARAVNAENERAATVTRILAEACEAADGVELDEFQTAGITGRAVNADDGSLDEAATRTAFDAAIAKLAEKAGVGRPRGLGAKPASTIHESDDIDAELDDLAESVFGTVPTTKEA